MAYTIELTYPVGSTVYAYPSSEGSFTNWATRRVEATGSAGRYRASVDADTYGPIWYFFEGAGTPASYDENIGSVDLQYVVEVDTLLDRTADGYVLSRPVVVDGSIEEIIIGDDYLAANGRAFEWVVDAVDGFVVGACTCSFGGKYKDNAWLVTGTITDNGDDTWTLSFDLEAADTATLEPGKYKWSVQVTHDGTEVTRVKGDCTTDLVEKQT